MSRSLPVLILLAACGEPAPLEWVDDVRLDGAAANSDPDSEGTRMCATDEGFVYVAWLDDRGGEGRRDLWLNRSVDVGKTWLQAPVRVNQGDGLVSDPDLACNENGVFVVWSDDRDGGLERGNIYFNHSVDGSAFRDADTLVDADPDGLNESLRPRLAVADTTVAVAWSDDRNGSYDIFVASSTDAGATFALPVRADSDTPGVAWSQQPQIAMSADAKHTWVVWQESRDGATDIYLAHSETAGRSFDGDLRIDEGDDDGANDSFAPQLCHDGDAGVLVVWHDARNGEGRDVYFNASTDGGKRWLSSAVRLDSDNAGFADSLFPRCTFGGGEFHVAWTDDREGAYDVYHRSVDFGVPGNEEARIDLGSPPGFANGYEVAIAAGTGDVVVAWRDERGAIEAGRDPAFTDLWYTFTPFGQPFPEDGELRIDAIPSGIADRRDVQLAVVGGTLLAAWTDGRNGTDDIYFRAHPLGEFGEAPPEEE